MLRTLFILGTKLESLKNTKKVIRGYPAVPGVAILNP